MEPRFRPLSKQEITQLQSQGCSAMDWSLIEVSEGFTAERIKSAHFGGKVKIGLLKAKISFFGGIERLSGIYNTTLYNCTIGNDVYINNIADYIANYVIEDNCVIENVDLLAVDGESSFGNGVEVAVINEAGGREVLIYDKLSAQVAYIMAVYRHQDNVVKSLKKMISDYALSVKSGVGTIGVGCKIVNCGSLKNIKTGPKAVLEGVKLLENGSINSCPEDPAYIGTGVIAKNFIICSGAKITENTIMSHCFVGQGTELGKQYSAENSVFFANCGGFHGEACSIFAGPYTVTHHKSTLLIAGLFSFLNAGSGSNQSNHMYKLGPVHQGTVERGSKTTSDSYMLWPAKVGAFSLVMGRHYANSDTSNLPFSYLIEHEDESVLVPGINLRSIGTIRDSQKWPKRDKRKDPNKFDFIIFNLLTPYTIQKVINGKEILLSLKKTSGETSGTFYYNGVKIKHASLEAGINFYQMAIDRYIGNCLMERLRKTEIRSVSDLKAIFSASATFGEGQWLDLAGLIAPEQVVIQLIDDIDSGRIANLDQAEASLKKIYDNFGAYEWSWILKTIESICGKPAREIETADVIEIIKRWKNAFTQLDTMRCNDAKKEFNPTSRIGFGPDGSEADKNADFQAVRGSYEGNSFINEIKEKMTRKQNSADEMMHKLEQLSNKN